MTDKLTGITSAELKALLNDPWGFSASQDVLEFTTLRINEMIKSAEEAAREEGLKQELEKSMQICKEASEEGYAEGYQRGQREMLERAANLLGCETTEHHGGFHCFSCEKESQIRALPIDSGGKKS